MANYIGSKLCAVRKKRGISQKEMAKILTKRGIRVTNQAVSKWEGGASLPNAVQFLIICDILDIKDISSVFLNKSSELTSGLNEEGKARVAEYADFLRDSGNYDDADVSGPRGTRLRRLPVYDLESASGAGRLLDMTDYELVTVGNEVPYSANFGVRITGDSMEPDYQDGQTVWISQQSKLEHGDVGVFMYERNSYFKRLRDRVGGMRLQCIDSKYPDVIITEPEKLVMLGKAVS
jgi:SOS-response transcriptional repressor LexA